MRIASRRLPHLAAVLMFLLLLAPACAAEAILVAKMGGGILAYLLPIGGADRLVIRRKHPRATVELSMFCQDARYGMKIENYEWSYGGSYLVFTTTSSGGHLPWNHRAYVFSTRHWAFLVLDDVVAPVTSGDFTFRDTSHVEIEIMRPDGDGSDDVVKKIVDLDALPWPAKPAETPASGNAGPGK